MYAYAYDIIEHKKSPQANNNDTYLNSPFYNRRGVDKDIVMLPVAGKQK